MIEFLVSTLGLPIASGINLYATVLVLGLGQRFGWISGLPQELAILSDPIVLGVAGFCYALEFFADKIPYLDTLWDGAHTFIRPLGAAFLAVSAATGYGPAAQWIALLVGASLGLGAHTAKAGTRMLVNTSPEPVSNSLVSVAEDVGVVGLLVLMYTNPWLALLVVSALIAAMAWATPTLYRTLRFLVAGVAGRFAAWFGLSREKSAVAPDWLRDELETAPKTQTARIYPCFARQLPGASRLQAGYLVLTVDRAWFAFRGFLRVRTISLGDGPSALRFERGSLFDVFRVAQDPSWRLCVPKSWSRCLQTDLGIDPDIRGHFVPARNR